MNKNKNLLSFTQELLMTLFICLVTILFGVIGFLIWLLNREWDLFWVLIISSIIGTNFSLIILRFFIKLKCQNCGQNQVVVRPWLFWGKAKCKSCNSKEIIDYDF